MRAVVVQVSAPWHDEHEWLNTAIFVGDDAQERAQEHLDEEKARSRPGFKFQLDEVPVVMSEAA